VRIAAPVGRPKRTSIRRQRWFVSLPNVALRPFCFAWTHETFMPAAALQFKQTTRHEMESAMIELLATVCLISSPSQCKDVQLSFAADGITAHQCMMSGQVELAKWVEGHPKWRIDRWTCRPAGQVAKI
jgi:hypothetical protein